MLECKIPASTCRRVFDALKDLVTESNIEFSCEGMEIQAVDSSHVALVHARINAEGFSHYRCDTARSLGINIPTFARILRTAQPNDTMTLKHGEEKKEYSDASAADTLYISFESETGNRCSDYNYRLMHLEQERLTIPRTDYPEVVVLSSAAFSRVCRDLESIGDSLHIEVTKKAVKFFVKGEVAEARIILSCPQGIDDTGDVLSIVSETNINQPFSFKFLSSFSKAAPLSSTVSLSLSESMPLMVEFKLADSTGFVRFYLAPKFEDETMG